MGKCAFNKQEESYKKYNLGDSAEDKQWEKALDLLCKCEEAKFQAEQEAPTQRFNLWRKGWSGLLCQ